MSGSEEREERERRAREVIEAYFLRQERGEAEPWDQVLAAHPDLRPLLESKFRADVELEAALSAGFEMPTSGRDFGDYRIVREIGKGGFARVYEAIKISLGCEVALKVLDPSIPLSTHAIERFKWEAQIAARFDGRGVVRVFDAGTVDGLHYLAMERCRGSLDRAITILRAKKERGEALTAFDLGSHYASDGTFTRAAAHLIERVAQSLQSVHHKGIVHRDIKPSNILLRSGGKPVLSDFGLARDPTLPRVSASGAMIGTLIYFAPEQHRGADATRASDVWALGASLYQLLTLTWPPGTRQSVDEVKALEALRNLDAPDPRRGGADVPRALAAIVQTALRADPNARYDSAHAFEKDLARFRHGAPVRAAAPSPRERVGHYVRTHRRALMAFVSVVVVIATMFAWMSAQSFRRREAVRFVEGTSRAQAGLSLCREAPERALLPLLEALRAAGDRPEIQSTIAEAASMLGEHGLWRASAGLAEACLKYDVDGSTGSKLRWIAARAALARGDVERATELVRGIAASPSIELDREQAAATLRIVEPLCPALPRFLDGTPFENEVVHGGCAADFDADGRDELVLDVEKRSGSRVLVRCWLTDDGSIRTAELRLPDGSRFVAAERPVASSDARSLFAFVGVREPSPTHPKEVALARVDTITNSVVVDAAFGCEAEIAGLRLANVDDDPEPEIVAITGANGRGLDVFDLSGTALVRESVPVPRSLDSEDVGAVTGADLDGNGVRELVAVTRGHSEFAVLRYVRGSHGWEPLGEPCRIGSMTACARIEMSGGGDGLFVARSDIASLPHLTSRFAPEARRGGAGIFALTVGDHGWSVESRFNLTIAGAHWRKATGLAPMRGANGDVTFAAVASSWRQSDTEAGDFDAVWTLLVDLEAAAKLPLLLIPHGELVSLEMDGDAATEIVAISGREVRAYGIRGVSPAAHRVDVRPDHAAPMDRIAGVLFEAATEIASRGDVPESTLIQGLDGLASVGKFDTARAVAREWLGDRAAGLETRLAYDFTIAAARYGELADVPAPAAPAAGHELVGVSRRIIAARDLVDDLVRLDADIGSDATASAGSRIERFEAQDPGAWTLRPWGPAGSVRRIEDPAGLRGRRFTRGAFAQLSAEPPADGVVRASSRYVALVAREPWWQGTEPFRLELSVQAARCDFGVKMIVGWVHQSHIAEAGSRAEGPAALLDHVVVTAQFQHRRDLMTIHGDAFEFGWGPRSFPEARDRAWSVTGLFDAHFTCGEWLDLRQEFLPPLDLAHLVLRKPVSTRVADDVARVHLIGLPQVAPGPYSLVILVDRGTDAGDACGEFMLDEVCFQPLRNS